MERPTFEGPARSIAVFLTVCIVIVAFVVALGIVVPLLIALWRWVLH